jgi:thiamine pyrophosphate-dependent acetolactate synthase large subunit-like protein
MIDGPLPPTSSGLPAAPDRTGAQVMREALIHEGVRVRFGVPGGCIMLFDQALWDYRDQLRHVLARHEQGGGHAAEGYTCATGQVGVCIGTSGPDITVPITTHNSLVTSAADLPRVLREAFHLARTGRPGPVLIDITKDAQRARVVPGWDVAMQLPGYRPARSGAHHDTPRCRRGVGNARLTPRRYGDPVSRSASWARTRWVHQAARAAH